MMTFLHRVFKISIADTFYAAAVFPLVGLLYALFKMPETKPGDTGILQLWRQRQQQGQGQPAARHPRRRRDSVAGAGAGAAAAAAAAEKKVSRHGARHPATARRRKRRRGDVAAVGRRDVDEGEWSADAVEAYDTVLGPAGAEEEEEVVVDSAMTGEMEEEEPGGVGGGVGIGTDGAAERGVGADGLELIPRAVMLLVGNGFLLMYAFSIETIYAMFLKVGMFGARARGGGEMEVLVRSGGR